MNQQPLPKVDAANLVARLRKERDDAEAKCADFEAKWATLQTERDALQTDRAALQKERAVYQAEWIALEKQLADAKKRCTALETEWTALQTERDDLQVERDTIGKYHVDAKKNWLAAQMMCDTLVASLAEANAKYDELHRAHVALKEESKKMEREISDLQAEFAGEFRAKKEALNALREMSTLSRRVCEKHFDGDEIDIDFDDDEGNDDEGDDDLFGSELKKGESLDLYDSTDEAEVANKIHFAEAASSGPVAASSGAVAAKTRIGLGGQMPYLYDLKVQQAIAEALAMGKTSVEVIFDDGEKHTFDLVKMIQTTRFGRQYAIREVGQPCSAAFVQLDRMMLCPYEKAISDKVCDAIARKVFITIDIAGVAYTIDGAKQLQVRQSTGFARRIFVM
jgi:hypothetical protein